MNIRLLSYIEKNNIKEVNIIRSENFVINQRVNSIVFDITKEFLDQLERYDIQYFKVMQNCIHIPKKPLVERKIFQYDDLVEILKILRKPNGCSWDKAQTHLSLRKNLIEETHELIEAIEILNIEDIKEELGDFILQGVFHICISEENNEFESSEVYTTLCKKLISRHTHIFGEDVANTPEEALDFWNKAKEKEKDTDSTGKKINKLCTILPSTMYAEKIIKIFENNLSITEESLKKEIIKSLKNKNINIGELIFKAIIFSRYLKKSAEVELNTFVKAFIKEQLISEKLENKFKIKMKLEKIREIYSEEISKLSVKDLITVLEDENWKPRD